MKTVQMRTHIGKDRALRITLPEGTPTGEVDLTIMVESVPHKPTLEERRAAADAGYGALKGVGGSLEEFLAERREDDRRRDRALGL